MKVVSSDICVWRCKWYMDAAYFRLRLLISSGIYFMNTTLDLGSLSSCHVFVPMPEFGMKLQRRKISCSVNLLFTRNTCRLDCYTSSLELLHLQVPSSYQLTIQISIYSEMRSWETFPCRSANGELLLYIYAVIVLICDHCNILFILYLNLRNFEIKIYIHCVGW